jgi:uncharacterized protein YbbC (DUF1343 family)
LYGKKRKPSKEDLADVDLMIYDIQDVGCRFYTYINVLRDVMESCAEFDKELLILDRPNLMDIWSMVHIGHETKIWDRSVSCAYSHGMTIAEFAQMINGEGWLPEKKPVSSKS